MVSFDQDTESFNNHIFNSYENSHASKSYRSFSFHLLLRKEKSDIKNHEIIYDGVIEIEKHDKGD